MYMADNRNGEQKKLNQKLLEMNKEKRQNLIDVGSLHWNAWAPLFIEQEKSTFYTKNEAQNGTKDLNFLFCFLLLLIV